MKCPTCKADAKEKYFPFCSEKCRLIDLYNWLNEEYYVPGEPVPEEVSDEFNKENIS